MAPPRAGARRSTNAASRVHWWLLMVSAASMLALDQGVKWIVEQNLPLGASITVTEWFNLVHVLNTGAAFSFLADAGGWQRHALTMLGVAVSVVLAGLLWRGVGNPFERAAYTGMIGGALGNVVDRVRIGAVVDYLDLHWHDMHWPAFNLADVFLVGSAALLVLASFRPAIGKRSTELGGSR